MMVAEESAWSVEERKVANDIWEMEKDPYYKRVFQDKPNPLDHKIATPIVKVSAPTLRQSKLGTLNSAEFLRQQLQNLYQNEPHQRQGLNVEREMYQDFRVRHGLESPSETDLLFSPHADFRRQ